MTEETIGKNMKSEMKKMKNVKKFNIYQALVQPNQTSQDSCNKMERKKRLKKNSFKKIEEASF